MQPGAATSARWVAQNPAEALHRLAAALQTCRGTDALSSLHHHPRACKPCMSNTKAQAPSPSPQSLHHVLQACPGTGWS
jgi:hypothetical protein